MIEGRSVCKYEPIVLIEIWLFTIFIVGLLITGLPLLRDVLYDFMGIYGGLLFETPVGFEFLHSIFGFILIIVGLMHIAIHLGDKNKELLTKNPAKDFKAFFHSLFYLFYLSRREVTSGGERYSGRQRIVYLALVYTIGLAAISGMVLFIFSPTNEVSSIFTFTHVVAAIFIILILLFHLAINIRHHDITALKCSYISGKLPLWYIKKNHKIWYRKILKHEQRIAKRSKNENKQKSTVS